jgi:hypothetical protein
LAGADKFADGQDRLPHDIWEAVWVGGVVLQHLAIELRGFLSEEDGGDPVGVVQDAEEFRENVGDGGFVSCRVEAS